MKKQFSGMWRRVDIVLTDVSEECIASVFRVERKEENPRARNQREQVLTEECRVELYKSRKRRERS
jgi:hypothetical protein